MNESVYIALSTQPHDVTLTNFYFHVLNHALERFVTEALKDFNLDFNRNNY